jgi:hypothetical protein
MYIKEDLILPHTATFYDFIINKAQPWALNPEPWTLNPKPWTLNPKPYTLNPEP